MERQLRTWFGTLTFSETAQDAMLSLARDEWMTEHGHGSTIPDWWNDPLCDERFRFVRAKVVLELRRYWARLRKHHKFRYLAVIERHKSGLPHVHWLLHEVDGPIRKRELQKEWVHGFTKVVVVGGRSKKSADPERAAFYVTKYLSKEVQARQLASQKYKPAKR